jgi:hypothetical protein
MVVVVIPIVAICITLFELDTPSIDIGVGTLTNPNLVADIRKLGSIFLLDISHSELQNAPAEDYLLRAA